MPILKLANQIAFTAGVQFYTWHVSSFYTPTSSVSSVAQVAYGVSEI